MIYRIEQKRNRLIIYNDKEAVGSCKYKINKQNKVKIILIYIDNDYRRQGFGTRLIDFICKHIGPIEIEIQKECTPEGIDFFRAVGTYYNIEVIK